MPLIMTPVIIMFIAEKKQPAKLPSVSDDYKNEVELLSKQLEDLSVCQSSEQSNSMAQNENYFAADNPADSISDISNDDSLQDIIDSILPSNSNGYSSYDIGKSSPARMNDVKREFSAGTIGNLRSDDDDDDDDNDDDDEEEEEDDDDDDDVCTDEEEEKKEGGVGDDNDDYHDNYDIQCDFEPLQTEVQGCCLHHDYEPEINEKSKTLVPSSMKGAEAIPDLKHVLECINTDDYYNPNSLNMDTKNGEPVEWPLTSLERKKLEESPVKPIPCTGSRRIVKSRDNYKGHRNYPTKTQRQNEKPLKSKLSDADLIEIFGSSDEEDDAKSFVMKQSSCSAKPPTKTCDTKLRGTLSRDKLHDVFDSSETVPFLHIPLQHAKMGFPCTNALTENGKEVMTNGKHCLASDLQGGSCVKSNVRSSIEDTDFEKDDQGNKEKQPKAIRKVLEPANTTTNSAFQPSMQAFDSHKENFDSVDDICSLRESSGKFQYESCKENIASPFEDCLPAPLSKRLGKQFSAKQRLAILHSISSVTDDS